MSIFACTGGLSLHVGVVAAIYDVMNSDAIEEKCRMQ